jgi:hypothetical protein
MAVTVTTIDAAITAIQDSGQSFTLDGFTYTKGNLNQLVALRDKVQREEERSGGLRPVFRGSKFTGMGY